MRKLQPPPWRSARALRKAPDPIEYNGGVPVETFDFIALNLTKLSEFPIPLPPSAEQRRIVAQVDRLLSNVEAAQALLCAAQTRLSLCDASTLNRAFRSGHPLCRIGDDFEVYVGSTPSRSVPEYWGGGIPKGASRGSAAAKLRSAEWRQRARLSRRSGWQTPQSKCIHQALYCWA